MARGELLRRLLLFVGVAGLLMGLIAWLGQEHPDRPSESLFSSPTPAPAPVRLPRGLAADLAAPAKALALKTVLIHRASGTLDEAREHFDLVVGASGEETLCALGRSWPERVDPESGRYHLGWVGPETPRLRAILVRTLEVALPALGLAPGAVRTHAEAGAGVACPDPEAPRCLAAPLSGSLIRGWIRGAGAGQGRQGR